jgi:hypothetical protein
LSWLTDWATSEIWSTTNPNNDGDPNGGLDPMWQRDARLTVVNFFGLQTWTDPNPISAAYKNYVIIQSCRPPNDECAYPIPVYNGVTDFNNIGADTDGPPASCGALGSDVWFTYRASCTGTVNVNTCGTSFFDTVIEVFGGTCGNLGTPITCNDDFCGTQSQVTFAATAGNTYVLRVGGYNSSQGPNGGMLNISCQ